ncbi:hypothetical protein [Spirosoma pomorum]
MRLEQKVNWLIAYALVSTVFIISLLLSGFSNKEKHLTVEELIAKKITVVGEDNLPRMVLSNEYRQHPGRMNGKEWAKRERPSGLIFFNDKGDECGGLIYQVKEKDGTISSGMSFTMDNYKDDQVIQILNDEYYADGKASVERGLIIKQFPVGSDIDDRIKKITELEKITDTKERTARIQELIQKEGAKSRLFLGRTKANSSGLFLSDPQGKPRMRIYVDEKGDPKIQTLNDKGEISDLILTK